MSKNAILALEDGLTFSGYAFGARGETFGEVVFNTSMTGYQEILTDPSYAGQIVTLTYPEIGNYGVNSEDHESHKPFVEGFVVRESSKIYSNWRAEKSLESFLKTHGIVGIEGIDTRMLVRHIRIRGAMKGGISSQDLDKKILVEKVRNSPGLVGRDLVKKVTFDKNYKFRNQRSKDLYKVVALDFGIKQSILKYLSQVNCEIEIVPAKTSAEEILALEPEGIVLSNGPGDPAAVSYAVETIQKLLGRKPIFGICLGHQLLALALGAKTYKLKFGHHGGNHPVKNLQTGRIEITAQNHGFAVAQESVQGPESTIQKEFGEVEVTHINLNDSTVEGLNCLDIPAFSVQYHPEASPGPHDSRYLFKQFKILVKEFGDSPIPKGGKE